MAINTEQQLGFDYNQTADSNGTLINNQTRGDQIDNIVRTVVADASVAFNNARSNDIDLQTQINTKASTSALNTVSSRSSSRSSSNLTKINTANGKITALTTRVTDNEERKTGLSLSQTRSLIESESFDTPRVPRSTRDQKFYIFGGIDYESPYGGAADIYYYRIYEGDDSRETGISEESEITIINTSTSGRALTIRLSTETINLNGAIADEVQFVLGNRERSSGRDTSGLRLRKSGNAWTTSTFRAT